MTGLLGILLAGVLSLLPSLLVTKRRRTLRALDQEAKVLAALREADAPHEALLELSAAMYVNARFYRRSVERQHTSAAVLNSRMIVAFAGVIYVALALTLALNRERLTEFFGLKSTSWTIVPIWGFTLAGFYFTFSGAVGALREVYKESNLRIWVKSRRAPGRRGQD